MSFGYQVLGFGSGGVGAPYDVEYLVVAGGGGAGNAHTGGYYSGGGGGGGYRNSYASEDSGKISETESVATLISGVNYVVVAGGGGAVASSGLNGVVGYNSSIIGGAVEIISLGGGFGQGGNDGAQIGGPGGCGGGAADGIQHSSSVGGLGTTAQGFDGGDATGASGGGGGGTGALGGVGAGTNVAGGAGLASDITTSSTTRSAGGMGGKVGNGTTKTANTGDGGDGINNTDIYTPSTGASGVVILRMLDSNYSGTTSGSPTVATGQGGSSDETIITFTGDGSYTA